MTRSRRAGGKEKRCSAGDGGMAELMLKRTKRNPKGVPVRSMEGMEKDRVVVELTQVP